MNKKRIFKIIIFVGIVIAVAYIFTIVSGISGYVVECTNQIKNLTS